MENPPTRPRENIKGVDKNEKDKGTEGGLIEEYKEGSGSQKEKNS